MKRGIIIGAAVLALALAGTVVFASWYTYREINAALTVGTPTAQSSGWPAPQRPEDIGYVGDPQAAFGYPFDTVNIETDLGPAPAWLVRPGTTAGSTWAIIVHGIGGRRENGYRFLPVFHDAGMPALLISYRNDQDAPASPDGHYAFGLTEWPDLEAAVQYGLDNGADSVVLLGESMGGGIVGQFMRQSQLSDRVEAIVLDAAAIDFRATLLTNMRGMGLPLPDLLASGGLLMAAWQMPFDLRAANVVDVFAEFAGPMFISHGSTDRVVPVSSSDELAARRRGPTVYLRTLADHIQSWKEDPARYDAALSGFLGTIE